MNQRDIHLPLPPKATPIPVVGGADTMIDKVMSKVPVSLADTQSSVDTRKIAIDRVGIKAIRHPVRVQGNADKDAQHTIATFTMSVRLPDDVKGTHMSRFIELIENNAEPISVTSFGKLLARMVERLGTTEGHVEIVFPYFVEKAAPVSLMKSMLDYEITLSGHIKNGVTRIATKIVAPVTSLCPCSKEISAYGAHNQRSHISITVRQAAASIWIEEIIRVAEDGASAELYGILKRVDEKFVTERAYDNPKFVEDLVRDIAAALDADDRIEAYIVESENFESIHNHSAFAVIERDKSLSA
jgi:GTP cyclohydrolase I